MNILVVGSGAREHTLVWKALQSPLTRAVYCAPGNAGTAAIAVNLPVQSTDVTSLKQVVTERAIDLTIIGPDAAVAAGCADVIAQTGRLVFGPTAAAGRIESSKAYAKALMKKAGVPTPDFQVFSDPVSAKEYVRRKARPFVVKADGLAKGKGTLVPGDVGETLEAIDSLMLARVVGSAGERIVLEEKIEGREVSLMAFVDGDRAIPMVPACDYKRALDGDRGPNTGGMGGYSPPGFFREADVEAARREIFQPIVESLKAEGTPYRGCLYAGLMVTEQGMRVLEFNARFGDPEAQVVLPRLQGDLIPILQSAARGDLSDCVLAWSSKATVGVVLASRGYPGAYQTGRAIEGLSSLEHDVFAFHAGTAAGPDGYLTAGGRVITLVATGDSLAVARDRVYRNVERVRFEGMMYRRDIAQREIQAPVPS